MHFASKLVINLECVQFCIRSFDSAPSDLVTYFLSFIVLVESLGGLIIVHWYPNRIRDDFEKEDAFRGLCAMVCFICVPNSTGGCS